MVLQVSLVTSADVEALGVLFESFITAGPFSPVGAG
jgi:hypothetical protein